RGSAAARRREAGRRGGLVPTRDGAGVAARRRARSVPRPGRREAGAGRHPGGARELSAGPSGRHVGRHAGAAGARKDQRVGQGGRAVASPAETPVRAMARCWVIALVGLAACHHTATVTPTPDAEVGLARARQQFSRGDFAHAMIALRRLTFEVAASQPQLAEVWYRLAECYFQCGESVQVAQELRTVVDVYCKSVFALLE